MDNAHRVTTAKTPEQIQEMFDEWARERLRELLRRYLEQLIR